MCKYFKFVKCLTRNCGEYTRLFYNFLINVAIFMSLTMYQINCWLNRCWVHLWWAEKIKHLSPKQFLSKTNLQTHHFLCPLIKYAHAFFGIQSSITSMKCGSNYALIRCSISIKIFKNGLCKSSYNIYLRNVITWALAINELYHMYGIWFKFVPLFIILK